MRRFLVVLTLLLVAAPLSSQERQTASQPDLAPAAAPAPVPATPEAPPAEAREATRPSLHVSTEQVDAQLRQDAAAAEDRQVGSKSWWYLVAAIALGVIVALLILD